MDKVGEEDVEVVIVGAGIAGLATALALKRVGAERVLVLERAPSLRATGAALTLFPNAWRALAALGVGHKLTPLFRAIKRARVTNSVTGTTQEVAFPGEPNGEGLGVRSVNRRILLETLAEELPPGTIRFSTKFTSIETQTSKDFSPGVVLHLNDGTVIRAKVLIGCDGVHSVVAQWLGLSAPVDSGRAAVRGLAVYPDGHGLDHEVQQFLGKSERAGIVPMNDTEVYWFITDWSKAGDEEMAGHPELMLKHVTESATKFPPQFLDVVRHADPSTLSWAPLLLRLPWNVIVGHTHRDCVTVAGDAMHPMTPDLGQGGCAALEDAVVLGRHLAACLRLDGSVDGGRVPGCLAGFVAERRWRAARLICGAYLSGWTQQGGGAGWWGAVVKFVRDGAFYRFLFPKLVSSIVDYDCGCLPTRVTP